MAREARHALWTLSAAIFILLEIAALAMLRSSSPEKDVWINRISNRVKAFIWRGGESVGYYFSLKEQNDELAAQNFVLRERLREYQAAGDTSFAFPGEVPDTVGGFRYIPSTVVKMSRNSSHNYVILDKGSEDGVVPYSGIISDRGVVGIINSVDRHFSYGFTLMNYRMSVSSRIGRKGVCGPLVWNGKKSNGAILKDIPHHNGPFKGDTVFTSGFSSIFPPDIPLGVISSESTALGEMAQAEVEIFQDFKALRYVTIVENIGRAEILALENREEQR